jgi:hypothetical protein
VVDLAKLPKVAPQEQTNKRSDAPPDRMTPAERQAYWNSLKTNPRVTNPTPATRSANDLSPSFVGGGVTPLLVRSVDGLTSAQSSEDWTFPDQAIATDLSYVMEGVNSAVAIYRASTGALQYGPYSAQSFFAPVYHAGDTFTTPQMYYDVMRDRWIVAFLERDASATFSYIDIAVSVSNSPTQPNPGGQYYIYQQSTSYFEPTGSEPSYCLNLTMGVDYWGLYFTCTNFRGAFGSVFVGNTMYAVNKGPMMTGATTNSWYVNDAFQVNGGPAYRLSASTEEGVQDAEFFVSTDSAFGGPSSNLAICAWTNLNNIATTMPTVTCQNVNLGLSYTDPLPVRQLGSPGKLTPGYGENQVYYKAGRLYLAQTTALGGDHDGVYWAEVQPQLTTKAAHNPQWINGAIVTQAGYLDYGSSYDVFIPTIIGTDENDIALVYNLSGPGIYPKIELTGRKATDAPGTLGQSGGHVTVVSGTHSALDWGGYSACAISLNSVTRGGIWCSGQYTGSMTGLGWNTRLYNFRTE